MEVGGAFPTPRKAHNQLMRCDSGGARTARRGACSGMQVLQAHMYAEVGT